MAIFDHITADHVLLAIRELDSNGIPKSRQSTRNDLVYQGKVYPPKLVLSLANKFAVGEELKSEDFDAGQAKKYLARLNFDVKRKEDLPVIDEEKLAKAFKAYQEAIDTTDWLTIKEGYKFEFIKWIQQNIDFTSESPTAIKAKIEASQQESFRPVKSEKGVNFIQTIIRFHDDYITENDIDYIRAVVMDRAVFNSDFSLSMKSYPKYSIFLSFFAPDKFMTYDQESLPSFAYLLSSKHEIAKKGWNAFIFHQLYYTRVKTLLKQQSLTTKAFNELLETERLSELDWNYITQDFLLYVTRRIMAKRTIQQVYTDFLKEENVEQWDWYIDLKTYSEAMQLMVAKAKEVRYNTYDDFNAEYKKKTNEEEDFLHRYLFMSDNGFSTIKQQLISLNQREVIKDNVAKDPNLLLDILRAKDSELCFELCHQLVGENKWSVIYRFVRAVFPEEFTAVDAPRHFKRLEKTLKDSFDIQLSSDNQLTKSKEIVSLVNANDLYAKQIFFWMLIDGLLIDRYEGSLNQILYGPPGTGKTYRTIAESVKICNPRFNFQKANRKGVKEEFDKLVAQGRIVFTTFHQSMSYEDFVEGIRPKVSEHDEEKIIYKTELGIFRKICLAASYAIVGRRENEKTYKAISFNQLYDAYLNDINERLLSHEEVDIATKSGAPLFIDGISDQGNFSVRHKNGKRNYTVSKSRLSKLKSEIGDLSEVQNIYKEFRAVIGGSNASAYWAVLNELEKKSQGVVFDERIDELTEDERKDIVNRMHNEDYKNKRGDNYVLIIDEINRGNVSQIFGELITLLESDKRLGKEEGLQVQLPYSNDLFGVPENVCIVGTMNTADRSVEALDNALRRRFTFVEVMPDYDKLKTVGDIDLAIVLKTINERIEALLDRDHQIGHSYLMNVASIESLQEVFNNNIIPLLQEYFYNDYEKIGMVLGKGFIKRNTVNVSFADGFTSLDDDKEVYSIVFHEEENEFLESLAQGGLLKVDN